MIGKILHGYIRLKNTLKKWFDHSEIFCCLPQTTQQDSDKYFSITCEPADRKIYQTLSNQSSEFPQKFQENVCPLV